nr:Packaging protein [Ipomoea batatas]
MSGQTVAETQGSQDEEELEEEELGNLEEEVTQMAEKVAEYRATLPDQLKTTLASLLAAQRPALQMHFDVGSLPQPGSSNAPASDLGPVESETLGTLTEEEQEETEKVQLLKQKILSNASAIPIVLKRMKDSIFAFLYVIVVATYLLTSKVAAIREGNGWSKLHANWLQHHFCLLNLDYNAICAEMIYMAIALQSNISSSVVFGTELLTNTPSIFHAFSTSNTTVLSPFPIIKIFFPIAATLRGGFVNRGDNLPIATHSLLSFCHTISLVPEVWSNTKRVSSITTAGPRQPNTKSESACCHSLVDGSKMTADTREDAA